MPYFLFKKLKESSTWEFLERFEDFEASRKARDTYRLSMPGDAVEMVAAATEAEARQPTTLLWNRKPTDQ